jgi:predicted ATPase
MIEELEIKNFKAFASAKVSLGRYTLLSGINSSGKSTVIQALALLRQARGYLYDESGGLPLNGELLDLGTGRDALTEFYNSTGEVPEIGFRIRAHTGRELEWRFRYGAEDDFLPLTFSRPVRSELTSEQILDPTHDSRCLVTGSSTCGLTGLTPPSPSPDPTRCLSGAVSSARVGSTRSIT